MIVKQRQSVTSVPTCSYCRTPHADLAEICSDCTDLLRHLLDQVPGVIAELETSLARQTRIGRDVGPRSRSVDAPLPFDVEASEATDFLVARTVTRWALDVWRATESPLRSNPPTDPAGYLRQHVDEIRFRGYAGTLLDEIQTALDHAWTVIDLAADYLEAGSCLCGTRLVAAPDHPSTTCRGCGSVYDVRDRREQMVEAAEAKLLPAKDIERLVDVFIRIGATDRIRRRIPSGSVRGWASKGDLVMRGYGADGRTPLYRVGDVFDRAYRELAAAA